jgi:DNA-binding NarL/FixJ family response regulator
MSVHHRDEKVGVLVVDDHPALRAGLRDLFATEPGMRCAGAHADTRDLPALVER